MSAVRIVEPEIRLINGSYYHYLDEQLTGRIDIETVAHALSHICRYTGHVKRFYSVAEHSVRASYIGPPDEALERLMHDDGEAFIGDINTPLKMQLGEKIHEMEERAERLLADQFGYSYPHPKSVRIADVIMLATEKRDLTPPNDTKVWKVLEGVTPLKKKIPGWSLAGYSPYWKRRFIKRYQELTLERYNDDYN